MANKNLRSKKTKRTDGLSNVLTGMGYVSTDKMTSYTVTTPKYNRKELANWHAGCGIFKKICELPVKHMVRNGFKVTIDNDDVTSKIEEYFKRKNIHKAIEKVMVNGWNYGGGALFLVTDQVQTSPDKPLNIDNVKELKKVLDFDAFEMLPNGNVVTDYNSPYYRLPEFYSITDKSSMKIHASHILRFDPIDASFEIKPTFNYWSPSILAQIEDQIKAYESANSNANYLLADTGLKVMTMSNLSQLLSMATENEDGTVSDIGEVAIKARLQALELQSSSLKTLVIDKDETITRLMTNFQGIPEMLQKAKEALAAEVNIPHTLLFNESPSGLGATGNTDLTHWNEEIKQLQENQYRPLLEPIIKIAIYEIYKTKKDFELEFNPLQLPTPKEEAEIQQIRMNTAVAAISSNIASESEVRQGMMNETHLKMPFQFDESVDELLESEVVNADDSNA